MNMLSMKKEYDQLVHRVSVGTVWPALLGFAYTLEVIVHGGNTALNLFDLLI